MHEYVNDLILAYKAVPENYQWTKVYNSLNATGTNEQRIERVFTAELYHQWRCIMECKHMKFRYENLILHNEIGKVLVKNESVKHPDLVLHGGQIGKFSRVNKLYIELKIDSLSVSDLDKLFAAVINLKYEFAIYLVHKMSFEKISTELKEKKKYKNHVSSNTNNVHDRVLFINNKYTYKSFAELVK